MLTLSIIIIAISSVIIPIFLFIFSFIFMKNISDGYQKIFAVFTLSLFQVCLFIFSIITLTFGHGFNSFKPNLGAIIIPLLSVCLIVYLSFFIINKYPKDERKEFIFIIPKFFILLSIILTITYIIESKEIIMKDISYIIN